MKKVTNRLINLTNATDVIDALGGPDRVASLTEAKDPAVWNWLHAFEAFPANTYVLMMKELRKLGYTAPPHLWKMRGFAKPSARKRAA